MRTLLKYELKVSFKSLLIWTISVGGLGFICLLLFKSMEASMADMADNFSNMGAFSEAFGMTALSIATPIGYFATEIGTIHALGSGIFAASIATTILSKEEDGHTAEFTYSLPVRREQVVIEKMISIVINLIIFTIVCGVLYKIGFIILGEENSIKEFYLYMALQFLMNIEVATICFLISAVNYKNKLGIGIGVALILYIIDLMTRVIPDLEKIKWLSPFSYSNATDVFSRAEFDIKAICFAALIIFGTYVTSYITYTKKDLK